MRLIIKKKRGILFLLLTALTIAGSAVLLPADGMFTLNAAEQTKEIVVGTNAEYSPFEYRDSDGELTGFDYDLLEAIAEVQGIELVWNDLPFDSLMGSMEAGDIQIIAAAVGPTEERERSVNFSDVYYTGSQSIICNEGADITEFADLTGKTVAVLEGSMSDLIVSGENTDYGMVEDADVKRFKTASSAVMELMNQGADAVVIDTIMAEIYCDQTTGIIYTEVPGTEEDTVFCIQKGNTVLTELINEGLAKVRENGTYDELYEKYFSGEGEDTAAADEEQGFLGKLKFIFLDENRWQYYVSGVEITILISILSTLVGTLIGLFVAIVRLRADRMKRKSIVAGIALRFGWFTSSSIRFTSCTVVARLDSCGRKDSIARRMPRSFAYSASMDSISLERFHASSRSSFQYPHPELMAMISAPSSSPASIAFLKYPRLFSNCSFSCAAN